MPIKKDDGIQRRSHFRLRYPEEERLQLCTDEGEFFVCEVSESGLRIVLQSDTSLEHVPDRLVGLLSVQGDTLAIEGRVLRRDGKEAVLVLSEGIPLPLILNEQRRLLRKYPGLFGRD
ncbi:MAG: PilZ domain-containing protein [Oceanococcus sp.]